MIISNSESKASEFEKKMNKSVYSYTSIIDRLVEFNDSHEGDDLNESQRIWVIQNNCAMKKSILRHFEFLLANIDEYNRTYNFNETKESIVEASLEHVEDYMEYSEELSKLGKTCEPSEN